MACLNKSSLFIKINLYLCGYLRIIYAFRTNFPFHVVVLGFSDSRGSGGVCESQLFFFWMGSAGRGEMMFKKTT